MQKLQDQLDKRGNSTESEMESAQKKLINFHLFFSIFQNKPTTTRSTYFDNNSDDDNCDAYINTKLFGKELNKLSCKDNDLFLGQFFLYYIIFIPFLITCFLAFIFYIVFFFGCFCCCKARERTFPSVVSIVFFGLIVACMLITVIFHIIGAVYFMNIINFFSSDKLYDEVEEMMNLVEPQINKALSSIYNEISSTLNIISNGLFNVVDSLGPMLTDSVNSTFSVSIVLQFDQCKIDYIQKNVNLTLVVEAYNQVEEEIGKMNASSEFSKFMEPISEMLNSTFSDFYDQINIENISVSDLGSTFEDLMNVREEFDINEYIQSWMITAAKALLFVVSILMLLLLVLQVLAFWTMNCCSRCIVGACFPCCFCSCFQTICGIFITSMGLFLLIINILYYQGDDIINKCIERVTNENKTIQIRYLNFSGLTQNLISEIKFDELKIRNISAVKSIVDAKLDFSLSDLIGFKNFQLRDIAELLNNTFSNSKESTNPGLIVDLLTEVLTNITDVIIENFNSTTSFGFNKLRDGLKLYKEYLYDNCGGKIMNCEIKFIDLSESYELFISNMSIELNNIQLINNEVENNAQSFIQKKKKKKKKKT